MHSLKDIRVVDSAEPANLNRLNQSAISTLVALRPLSNLITIRIKLNSEMITQ